MMPWGFYFKNKYYDIINMFFQQRRSARPWALKVNEKHDEKEDVPFFSIRESGFSPLKTSASSDNLSTQLTLLRSQVARFSVNRCRNISRMFNSSSAVSSSSSKTDCGWYFESLMTWALICRHFFSNSASE